LEIGPVWALVEHRRRENRSCLRKSARLQKDFCRHLRGMYCVSVDLMEILDRHPYTIFRIIPAPRSALTLAKDSVDKLANKL